MLQNLVPDTPYNITVEAVYPEGPGGSLTGPGRTGEFPDIPEITGGHQRSIKSQEGSKYTAMTADLLRCLEITTDH